MDWKEVADAAGSLLDSVPEILWARNDVAALLCTRNGHEFVWGLGAGDLESLMEKEGLSVRGAAPMLLQDRIFDFDLKFEAETEKRIHNRHGVHGGVDRAKLIQFILELTRILPVVKIDEMILASETKNHAGIHDLVIQWAEMQVDLLVA